MYHIVYIADDNYFLPTKVSVNSLIANSGNAEITIHIVSVGISDANKFTLENMASDRIRTVIYDAKETFSDIEAHHPYVSKAALQKFMLPCIFSDIDKVLYVDGDTLLLPGFLDFFDTDIDNAYAAVVMDINAMRKYGHHTRLGLKRYFNSGVMLLNLAKMRAAGMSKKLVEYKKTHPSVFFMDQDCFNAVFGKDVVYVGLRFNRFANLDNEGSLYSEEDVLKFFGASHSEFVRPSVLHFPGHPKPWNSAKAEHLEDWVQYLYPRDAGMVERNHVRTLEAEIHAFYQPNRDRPYRLGDDLLADNTYYVTLSGFHKKEPWGRWTGGTATIDVSSEDFVFCSPVLVISMVLHSYHEARRLKLVFNDVLIHEATIPCDKAEHLTVPIERRLIKPRNSIQIIPVGDILSPQELQDSPDARKLAFAIRYVRISQDVLTTFCDLERRLANMENETLAIKQSLSYKLGRAITFIPRKVKKWLF